MLFFAVTLGFLAENLRDQYIEKERAHELIFQLKTDIKNNIHLIDSVCNRDKVLVQRFDSAMVYLISNQTIDADSLFHHMPSNIFKFLSKDDTYDQMKSSGSLRYIKDSVLLEKILAYASDCQAAEARSSVMEGNFVATEYTNTIDAWMPVSEAAHRYFRDRTGITNLSNKEKLSQAVINAQSTEFIQPLHQFNEPIVYRGAEAKKLKAALVPVLARREGLLVNTVRFMGMAKESGEDLLTYIEHMDH